MNLSDQITKYILGLLEIAESGETKLKRNELAEKIGCVPSQINYVLSSRFTPEYGYVVESQRGGGGYILIRQIDLGSTSSHIMHIVNSIGDELEVASARVILENLAYQNIITEEAAKIIGSALSDRAYTDISPAKRDRLRASIFKQMLITVATL